MEAEFKLFRVLLIKTFRRILAILSAREKIALASFGVLRSAASLIDLGAIAILAMAVAVGTGGKSPQIFGISLLEFDVGLLLVVSTLLFVSKTFLGLFLTRASLRYLASLEARHSENIARKIFGGGLLSFRRFSRQDIEWGVLRSTENLLSGFLGQCLQFVSELTLAMSIVVLFFVTDPTSASLVLGYLVFFGVVFHLLTGPRIRRAGEAFSNQTVQFMRLLSDMATAYREMVVLGATENYLQKLRHSRESVAFARASDQFLAAIPRLVVEAGLIVGALIFVSVELVGENRTTDFVSLTVFLAGSFRMMSAVLPLQRSVSSMIFLREPSATALDFLENLEELPKPQLEAETFQVDGAAEMDGTGPLEVMLTNVSFSFPDGDSKVVDAVSFRIVPGSLVAIVGPSGSGKSTLADLIIGLQRTTEGSVLVDGIEPWKFRQEYPGLLGYVPQRPGIVGGSILANVALGVSDEEVDLEKVRDSLKRAELLDVVEKLDGGIHASIGKHNDSLSGGQLQRLGIARALYFSPRFLVLDEATSALDAETESSIAHTLAAIKDDCSVLVIAHRLSTIQDADNILVLQNGRLFGQGTFFDLNATNSLFREFVRLSELKTSRGSDLPFGDGSSVGKMSD